MKSSYLQSGLLHVVSLALVFGGFSQASHAGVIETGYMVEQENRAARIERVEVFLASENVAKQLASLGVDRTRVAERIRGLSDSELVVLEKEMDEQIAGGDALSLIGAVFLVLLILELVGVTDVFKRV